MGESKFTYVARKAREGIREAAILRDDWGEVCVLFGKKATWTVWRLKNMCNIPVIVMLTWSIQPRSDEMYAVSQYISDPELGLAMTSCFPRPQLQGCTAMFVDLEPMVLSRRLFLYRVYVNALPHCLNEAGGSGLEPETT